MNRVSLADVSRWKGRVYMEPVPLGLHARVIERSRGSGRVSEDISVDSKRDILFLPKCSVPYYPCSRPRMLVPCLHLPTRIRRHANWNTSALPHRGLYISSPVDSTKNTTTDDVV